MFRDSAGLCNAMYSRRLKSKHVLPKQAGQPSDTSKSQSKAGRETIKVQNDHLPTMIMW